GNLNTDAINEAIALGRLFKATLVALSLIYTTHREGQQRKIRLEEIQQSKDFLEVVRHKARRQRVPLESVELYTPDAVETIRTFSGEMDCACILLFLRKNRGQLLASHEIKRLMEQEKLSVFLLFMPTRQSIPRWPRWIFQALSPATRHVPQHLT
ncbi:MAG: hypothetical protein J2P37_29370, partial [Ktedonobacteraceae bacterium]|nr:hypothetical protein [Ktedonobacteraceae bacterium]